MEAEHRSLQDAMEHCQKHKIATVFVGETTPPGCYSGYRDVPSLVTGAEASVTLRLLRSGAVIACYRTPVAKARYQLSRVACWDQRGA